MTLVVSEHLNQVFNTIKGTFRADARSKQEKASAATILPVEALGGDKAPNGGGSNLQMTLRLL